MEKLIGACGLVCSDCEAYKATKSNDTDAIVKLAAQWSVEYGGDVKPEGVWCDGCLTSGDRKCGHCAECDVRECVIEHGVANCAYCDEYGCDTIRGFMEVAECAKESLESIRKNLGK